MTQLQKKSLMSPDQVNEVLKGKVAMANLDGVTFSKMTFEPGWKWSESIKPMAKTNSCQMQHTSYYISGTIHVVMDDGTSLEFGPGDVGIIPPGHDAWVVGDEAVVMIDISIHPK